MELAQHLFNRREVVALLLDFDDDTLGRSDYALPAPPTFTRSLSGSPSAAAYTPPQTRLDVAREALIAFVSTKLRSAPSSSAMTFGLYAVRGDGARNDDVVELVAPATATGSASGRAVQDALRALGVGNYVYGTNMTAVSPHASAERAGKKGGGKPEAAVPYSGVLRALKQLQDAAAAVVPQQAAASPTKPPSSAAASPSLSLGQCNGSATMDGVPCAARGKVIENELGKSSSSSGAVVVHGVVVRSRSVAPPDLSAIHAAVQPSTSASATASAAEATSCSLWLDLMVLDTSLEVAKPATHGGSSSPPLSRESVRDDCRCAVLDPVELTGIRHRGLALGPALARVMTLPEPRNTAFVQRPLTFLKILRSASTTASADVGTAAAVVSAASSKSTPPNTTNSLGECVATIVVATPPAVRGRSTPPPQLDSTRGVERSKANHLAAVAAAGTSSTSGRGSTTVTPPGSVLPTVSIKAPATAPPVNPRTTLPRLSSGAGQHSGTAGGSAAAAASAAGIGSETHRPPLAAQASSSSSNNGSFKKDKSAISPSSPLPAVSQKSWSSTASSPKHSQTVITKQRDRTAARANAGVTVARPSATVEGSVGATREVSFLAGSSSVHRYANSSPDNAVSAPRNGANDDDGDDPNKCNKTPPVKTSSAKRGGTVGPTPSVGGLSPETSFDGANGETSGGGATVRRPPSSTSTATTSTRHAGVAATTQAPLSSAAVRQQQQQQQQQQQASASAEHSPPHALFSPQPPPPPTDGMQGLPSPRPRPYGEDAVNPRGSGAVSAGTQRSTPPPTGAAGRRVSAGSPVSGGGTRNAQPARGRGTTNVPNRTA